MPNYLMIFINIIYNILFLYLLYDYVFFLFFLIKYLIMLNIKKISPISSIQIFPLINNIIVMYNKNNMFFNIFIILLINIFLNFLF